jgi:putative membrane protein
MTMARMTFKAMAIVSLLITLVLSINLLVGAQENKTQTGDAKTEKKKTDQSMNSSATAGALNSKDRGFVMEAAHDGMMEVELGRIAAQKASSDDVKSFAQRMVDDHSKANDELLQLASQKGITLPRAEDFAMMSGEVKNVSDDKSAGHGQHGGMDKDHQKMMAKHQRIISKLNALSGSDFDKEYMDMMVEDHQKAVALFERQAARGGDADIKSWASGKVPALREHLQLAREVESKVKGK